MTTILKEYSTPTKLLAIKQDKGTTAFRVDLATLSGDGYRLIDSKVYATEKQAKARFNYLRRTYND